MYNLEFLPSAREDMVEIVRYISKELHNPAAAERLARLLVEAAERAAQFPYANPAYFPVRPVSLRQPGLFPGPPPEAGIPENRGGKLPDVLLGGRGKEADHPGPCHLWPQGLPRPPGIGALVERMLPLQAGERVLSAIPAKRAASRWRPPFSSYSECWISQPPLSLLTSALSSCMLFLPD